jgi:hypothetical protein
MGKSTVRMIGFAAVLCAVSIADTCGAMVGRPLPSNLARTELDSIIDVRCCGWGPRGWYDS